ncbi:class I SAM-dependent methyltransferase [Gemmata sp. JC673]|uniref:Class I SAM-dependent methyltransferase n=1 Tax=Gemmata algarum TaxID=2975278 RepID=A0ABU5EXE3_9BACT|nr:class I SAM-dependent methyltransferase [Gemmata algarum]MDY3558314.1 class I SAM-dependent methyltransferase [Gemmata algarum]
MTTLARAEQTHGTSGAAIYQLVARVLAARHSGGGTVVDVGCGRGELYAYIKDRFGAYAGTDVLRYDGFPDGAAFHLTDLDSGRVALPDAAADCVVAVETIEHLENPRAFARELVRLVKPGGWVAVTTPNQLSLLSLMTLLVLGEFNGFRERPGLYPAHITALLEIDLRRIFRECGLVDVAVEYTQSGRIPGTRWHWPKWASRLLPRRLSDNVLVVGRRPAENGGGT